MASLLASLSFLAVLVVCLYHRRSLTVTLSTLTALMVALSFAGLTHPAAWVVFIILYNRLFMW